ncbi:hypothetical protein [Skermania piniformis]|uniref:Uncharacterized protein n=1 Tax=Skermania pinensis TaxID=39122 RepID=A0ABX8SC87_9ACTN|nr:hypothetical protein [Skermania piniformis]QXQ15056.1 hypothetical protein KV203_06800 [Skermania piniformis]
MALAEFAPPGNLTDFTPAQAAAWSRFIADAIAARSTDRDGTRRTQFFDPIGVSPAADAVARAVTWSAFPRRITLTTVPGVPRWRAADRSRDVQDEYCEWSVERTADGRIKRVSFTCEGPEYWAFLASSAPEVVLDRYRRHVSPSVRREDLFTPGDRYIARNRWNVTTTGGAMHLVQQNNTLLAEIELAAAATVQRRRGGRLLTSAQELIACSRYGDPDRNSDPHIGSEINALARAGAEITLTDPVGLYLDGLSTAGWATPDGADPADFWQVTRGADGFAVRAVYEVTGHDYLVGDITILGEPIVFGAQIAEHITMRLTGLAHRFGTSTAQPRGCLDGSAGAPGPLDVAAALVGPASTRI